MKLFRKKRFSSFSRPDFSRQAIKASFGTITAKNGVYSAAAVVVVILIAMVINLVCGKLPSTIRQVDISSNRIYEVSETSRKMLRELEYDIQFTVIAEAGSIDERLQNFLNKYTALSDKIAVETIDPILHPSALTEYETEKDTIVIACEETGLSTQVAFSDILVESMSYYSTGGDNISSFDGEGQLTGAINQVTGQKSRKIYCLTDHGEMELSSSLTSLMKKSGITAESYSLLMQGDVPKDCDMIIMNGPVSDISGDEQKILNHYIKSGGSLMMLLSERGPEEGNLTKLLEMYHIKQESGYIADMERCYQGNYYYIFPNVTATEDMAGGLSSGMVLLANSRGFSLEEDSEDITVSSFLETSANGYAVSKSSEKQGTYSVGARAVYTAESEDGEEGGVTTGNLIVYGSSFAIDESITGTFTSLDNNTLFMNSLTEIFGETDNLSIEAKSMEIQYNMVQYGGYISILLIFIIPVIVLITGFVFWMKRRRA